MKIGGRKVTKNDVKLMRRRNALQPETLTEIPRDQWPNSGNVTGGPDRVYRSRRFLVLAFDESEGLVRLSVNIADVGSRGWKEGISWEELQQIKRECGYGEHDACEVFPADKDIVNVANMRHLWVFTASKIPFAWRAK